MDTSPVLAASLVALTFAVLGIGVWVHRAYQRDLRASRERLRGASRVIETSCGPIEYAEVGAGFAVLVVHGAGGGFDQGIGIGRVLASRGFRVIAMSRFGYLQTPLPSDASSPAQADAHAALMDALGIERSAIIGGSAGALSALQFAIRHARRCAALVLLVPLAYAPPEIADPAPIISSMSQTLLLMLLGSDIAFWLGAKFARNMIIKRVLGTPPQLVGAAKAGEQARVARIIDDILPIGPRLAGIRSDFRLAASLTRFDLEKISAPTLVLSLRDDLYRSFPGAEYTAKQIPGARFVGYENGGHVWIGYHEQVVAEIEAFLTSNNDRFPRSAAP
jgi:2-hydroxy-6-oxonona-2,4-dienedioate hydrolase